MSVWIFLDTGPLGTITNPKKSLETLDMLKWAAKHIQAGNRIMVPAIADYEVRRELIRSGRAAGIRALDTWNATASERYIPLSDAALKRAAVLWAQVRNIGVVTADPKEIDGDALIAAQALEYQQENGILLKQIIVATTNVGHLSHFVPAKLWTEI